MEKACLHCGKTFNTENTRKKYCNAECRWAFTYQRNKDKRLEKECPICGNTFDFAYGQKRPTYCSTSCRMKAFRLRRSNENPKPKPSNIIKYCKVCGLPFEVSKSSHKIICSDECTSLLRSARRSLLREQATENTERHVRSRPEDGSYLDVRAWKSLEPEEYNKYVSMLRSTDKRVIALRTVLESI